MREICRCSLTGTYESAGGRVDYTDAFPVRLAAAVNDIPDGHVQLPVLEQHISDGLLCIILEDGIASVLLRDRERLIDRFSATTVRRQD